MNFKLIYDNIILHAPKGENFLEVNPYIGNSTLYLKELINKSGKDIKQFVVTNTDGELEDVTYIKDRARGKFKDRSLGFIFLDYSANIIKDIILWYPTLKRGGFFAGYKFNQSELDLILKERYVIINDCFLHRKLSHPSLFIQPEERGFRLCFGGNVLPGVYKTPQAAQIHAWRCYGYRVKEVKKQLETSYLNPEDCNSD